MQRDIRRQVSARGHVVVARSIRETPPDLLVAAADRSSGRGHHAVADQGGECVEVTGVGSDAIVGEQGGDREIVIELHRGIVYLCTLPRTLWFRRLRRRGFHHRPAGPPRWF